MLSYEVRITGRRQAYNYTTIVDMKGSCYASYIHLDLFKDVHLLSIL
jgi:hypothetical protein